MMTDDGHPTDQMAQFGKARSTASNGSTVANIEAENSIIPAFKSKGLKFILGAVQYPFPNVFLGVLVLYSFRIA
jgi:hypothetical protein